MKIANAVTMAQQLLMDRLPAARCVVDATAGNGNDTLFLARHTPADAAVWAFDIQAEALERTRALLAGHRLEAKLRTVHDCHGKLAQYMQTSVDVIMFNLGYLPGGSHRLTTTSETTVPAVAQALSLLAVGGLATITAYPGHPSGEIEHRAVRELLAGLAQQLYTVACWQMVNQKNDPPLLYIVERIRGESGERRTACEN